MNKNTIVILLMIALIAGIILFVVNKKKGKSSFSDMLSKLLGGNEKAAGQYDDYGNLITPNNYMQYGGAQPYKSPDTGATIIPHSGITPKGGNDKDFFRAMGFGDVHLDRLSKNDAKIARSYTENYLRKGIKILPSDKIYKDVVRISRYINLFQDPSLALIGQAGGLVI